MSTWVLLCFSAFLAASATPEEYHGSKTSSVTLLSYSPDHQDQINFGGEHRNFRVLPPTEGIGEKTSNGGEHYHTHSNRPGILHSRYVATNTEEDPSKSSTLISHSVQSQDSTQEKQEDSGYQIGGSDGDQSIRRFDDHDQLVSESSQHVVYIRPATEQAYHLQSQERNLDSTNDRQEESRYYDTSSSSDSVNTDGRFVNDDQLSGESAQHAVYVRPPVDHIHSEYKYLKEKTPELVQNSFSSQPKDQSVDESIHRVTFVHPPRERAQSVIRNGLQENFNSNSHQSGNTFTNGNEYSSKYHHQSPNEGTSHDNSPLHEAHGESRDGLQRKITYSKYDNTPPVANHNTFPTNPYDQPFRNRATVPDQLPLKDTQGPIHEGKETFHGHYVQRENNPPVSTYGGVTSVSQDQNPPRNLSQAHYDLRSQESNYEKNYDKQREGLNFHVPASFPSAPTHSDGSISSVPHDQSSHSYFINRSQEGRSENVDGKQSQHLTYTSTNNAPVANHNRIFSSPLEQPSAVSSSSDTSYRHRFQDNINENIGDRQPQSLTYSSTNNASTATYNNRVSSNIHGQASQISSFPSGSSINRSRDDITDQSSNRHPQYLKHINTNNAPVVIHNRVLSSPHDQYSDHTASRATYVDRPHANLQVKLQNEQQEGMQYGDPKISANFVVNYGTPPNFHNKQPSATFSQDTYVHQPHGGNHNQLRNGQEGEWFYKNPTNRPLEKNQNVSSSTYHDQQPEQNSLNYPYIHQSGGYSSEQSSKGQQEESNYRTLTSNFSDVYNNGKTSFSQEQNPEQNSPRRTYVHQSYGVNHENSYGKQKEAVKYASPTSNPPVVFQSSISSNAQDLSSSKRANRPSGTHPTYKDNHEIVNINQFQPNKVPSTIFNRDYSSETHDQSSNKMYSNENVMDQSHRDSQIRSSEKQQGDIISNRFSYRPNYSVNRETMFPNPIRDQLSDASLPHAAVVEPHTNNNYETHKDDKIPTGSQINPSNEFMDGHLSNANYHLSQNLHQPTNTGEQPEDFSKRALESEFKGATMHPPILLRDGLLHDFHKIVGSNTNDPYYNGQISHGDSHKGTVHGNKADNLKYYDMDKLPNTNNKLIEDTYKVTKGTDHTRNQHKNDAYGSYSSEHTSHSGDSKTYDSRDSISPAMISSVKQETHKKGIQHEPIVQNPDLHMGRQGDKNERERFGVHHKLSDFVPYSGTFTKPQIIHDFPKGFTHEIASVKVEPFGTPKAQPPSGFKSSFPLNNHFNNLEDHRSQSQQIQNHSSASNHNGENQHFLPVSVNNELSEYPFGYAPFASYRKPSAIPHEQMQQSKTNFSEHAQVGFKPLTYVTQDIKNDHYSNRQSSHEETQRKESPHHPYHDSSISSQEQQLSQQQQNIKHYNPQNFTRISTTLTAHPIETQAIPPYPHEGQYVTYHPSDTVNPLSGNHNIPNPKVPFDETPSKRDSTHPGTLVEVGNHHPHREYTNNDNYNRKHSSESVASTGPYHDVPQLAPPSISQTTINGHNTTHQFNIVSKPHSYIGIQANSSTGSDSNTKTHQERISQAHERAPTTILKLLQPNTPFNENSGGFPIGTDSFSSAENSNTDSGYPSAGHHQIPTSGDSLKPGFQHEYALKYSYNKPYLIPQPVLSIPYSNQSAPFGVTPVPQILSGYLGSASGRPTGLPGYFDSQHGYAAHIPYQASATVKPLVVQSGYQEDTHEISHAKNDHVHVHHSTQSGYHYGILS